MSLRLLARCLLSSLASLAFQVVPTYRLETLIGAGPPASTPALEWNFSQIIYVMTLDREGSLWFIEGNQLRKWTRDGRLHDVPLQSSLSPNCDMSIRTNAVYSIAIGPDALPYVFDPWCRVIRRIHADGRNEVWAGRLDRGASGDGGQAKDATLQQVTAITFDSAGNLWMVENDARTLRRIDTRGVISRIAPLLRLDNPWGVTVDRQGNVYISDNWAPYRIVKVAADGSASTFKAALDTHLFDLGTDGAGNLYVNGGYGRPILKFAPDGTTSALATDYSNGLAVDAAGNIYYCDSKASLSVADSQGNTRRIAGTGKTAAEAGTGSYAQVAGQVNGVLPSSQGTWIFSDAGVYLLDPAGKLQHFLSQGGSSPVFDSRGSLYYLGNSEVWKLDAAQNGARVRVLPQGVGFLAGLAVDQRDEIYVTNFSSHQIYKLDGRTGVLIPFAGNGGFGDIGDGGPAVDAQFRQPWGIAHDRKGTLYVADIQSARVRKVDSAGVITTVAGTGVTGESGDGGPAAAAQLAGPTNIAVDVLGNLYLLETGGLSPRIRIVDRKGILRTIAGGPNNTETSDGTLAIEAKLYRPRGLAVANDGTVYFGDGGSSVRRLVPEVTEFPRTAAAWALHGATNQPGAIAPGMILTVYGSNFRDGDLVTAKVSGGRLATEAGSTSVLFDGVPARMLYAARGQVGVFVPYSLTPGKKTVMIVAVNGAQSTPVELDVVAARPGLFTVNSSGKGQGAILNQDASANSASNPALPGSIVVLYGTGEGQTTPAGVDGRLALGATLPRPQLPVTVSICGVPAEVLYAGAASGAAAGLLQVNARVPAGCAGKVDASVELRVGAFSNPAGVTIAVQ